jgi:hypothetical protein
MTLWDSEVIFGLTFTELANIVLGIIIVAGIIYSIFWKKREPEIT